MMCRFALSTSNDLNTSFRSKRGRYNDIYNASVLYFAAVFIEFGLRGR